MDRNTLNLLFAWKDQRKRNISFDIKYYISSETNFKPGLLSYYATF